MADIELKTDDEKAEELKRWWKENGISVVVGITLAIGGMFGWQQWKEHKKTQAEGASRLFSQLSDTAKQPEEVDTILKQLNTDFNNTPYNALASLKVAKEKCSAGKTEECITLLKVAQTSPQEDIVVIANLRLARALISSNKLDEAETLIKQQSPKAYASLVDEIKGDLHFAKKEFDKAREAYNRAILSSSGQNVQYLKMKRDDLGKS